MASWRRLKLFLCLSTRSCTHHKMKNSKWLTVADAGGFVEFGRTHPCLQSLDKTIMLRWQILFRFLPEWVSWSLTSLFSTNTAISETKGQGWKVIRTQWRKASDILTSTLAAFLFSSHPKKGKGIERFIMVALWNRADHYIFMLFLLSSFFFISSPNLSGQRLDVCHTSTHGMALVRI